MIWFLSAMEDNAEREKIEILYTTYKTWMWYLANSVLRDPQLAEDAVQEAFIALMRHLHKIEDPFEASTKSFLATIVKNKAIDILRKRQKTEEPIEEIIGGTRTDVLDQLLEKQTVEELVAAIKKLKDHYRIVLEYKFLHNLEDKEIAELLGISPRLYRVRLFRARKQLAEILKKEGVKS